ncbi:MAG: thioredoxin fold domain-containing protein [Gammaproteobacteria bacterium]|nr:thioredoxin fold domain-containing protein [Gammaproteobacteria bacterium]MCW8839560.1 thioredoxin fold domain-containing protein [Gammaproteobacteria bacterium]MCW8971995.1 thioredoxin fold domain-containing protein [Gammaproteobacteria bacterium]MCW8991964.1 thioredoxin fold domain-containing protein [Gammaproteobacteria bacterium]
MKIAESLKYFVVSLLIAAVAPVFAADDVKVLEIDDLESVGKLAADKRLPIMLMLSAEHCGYCSRVEEEYLKPMLRSGDYGDRALIRKMKIDNYNKMRDFDGSAITPAEFADRYDVFVTPTVVFLDGNGVEIGEKRVGLMTPDYYGGYLDISIDEALNILRRNKPMRVNLTSFEE